MTEHEHAPRHAVMTYTRPWRRWWKQTFWLRCTGCPVDYRWGPYVSKEQVRAERAFDFALWKAGIDQQVAEYQAEVRELQAKQQQRMWRLEQRLARRRRGGPLTRYARRPPRNWTSQA